MHRWANYVYGAYFVPKMQLQFSVLPSASGRQFYGQHMHSVFVLPIFIGQHTVFLSQSPPFLFLSLSLPSLSLS